MKKIFSFYFILLSTFALLSPKTLAQADLDIESGFVFSGYNDVRIPGDGGTLFSLSEELETDPEVFYRIRVYRLILPGN